MIFNLFWSLILLGVKKWVAPILDHILQDQSLDHSLVLDQDQGHTLERRDTGELLSFLSLSVMIVIPSNIYGVPI